MFVFYPGRQQFQVLQGFEEGRRSIDTPLHQQKRPVEVEFVCFRVAIEVRCLDRDESWTSRRSTWLQGCRWCTVRPSESQTRLGTRRAFPWMLAGSASWLPVLLRGLYGAERGPLWWLSQVLDENGPGDRKVVHSWTGSSPWKQLRQFVDLHSQFAVDWESFGEVLTWEGELPDLEPNLHRQIGKPQELLEFPRWMNAFYGHCNVVGISFRVLCWGKSRHGCSLMRLTRWKERILLCGFWLDDRPSIDSRIGINLFRYQP